MTSHLANMQILKEDVFLAYFVKLLQKNAFFLQGLSTVFIILYSFLHLMPLTLFIDPNNNISFGQPANTEEGHFS